MINIDDWEKQFDKNIKIVDQNNKKIVAESAQILKKRIEDRTPVGNPNLWNPPYWPKGYVPGTLKESWEISFNNVVRDEKTGQFAAISSYAGGDRGISLTLNTISIYNRQPYAYRVETGWSTHQAPQGMMRVSIMEYPDIVNSVATKYKI